jgi:hypothetical protein
MIPDRPERADNDHQVLPFRPRNVLRRKEQWLHRQQHPGKPAASPVEDLRKYEGEETEDNYRHRMLVNLAALLATIVLALAGVWLAVQLADLRKKQDCVLSGRRNCMPIDDKLLNR